MVAARSCPLVDLSLRTHEHDSPVEEEQCAMPSHDVARAIREGIGPSDRAFDRFLPHQLQIVSPQFWTPLIVAARAAEWFERVGVRTVVDIGSGAGKFCVAAALASGCEYTGLEQRMLLVDAARELARVFGIDDRVRFVHGTLGETPLPVADAYYVFNPFEENLFPNDIQLDTSIELTPARYERDIRAMTQSLRDAKVGTYLLTYNGFGGSVPATYREVFVDRKMPNVLRLWQKAQRKSNSRPHSADAL